MGFAAFRASAAWHRSPSRTTVFDTCEPLPSPQRSALRSVPLDSSSCRVSATDALSPFVERRFPSSVQRKRLLLSVPPRTSRPQGLAPLPSPLPALLRKRCKVGPILPWAFHSGVRVLRPDLDLRGQAPAPALQLLQGGAAPPDGQLVIAPVAAAVPKNSSVVERASTGHAGHERVVFTPVVDALGSAEALLCLSAGSNRSPRRLCPALSGCAGCGPKLAALRRLIVAAPRCSRGSSVLRPRALRGGPEGPLCSARWRRPTSPKGCRAPPAGSAPPPRGRRVAWGVWRSRSSAAGAPSDCAFSAPKRSAVQPE